MKMLALPIVLLSMLLAGCLELTPNVSTDFSELEAKALFESGVRQMCEHKKSRIPAIVSKIDAAEGTATIDHWIFVIDDRDAQVFPSGLITGEYHRHIQTALCRR